MFLWGMASYVSTECSETPHRLKPLSFTLLLPHLSARWRNLSHNCTIAWLIGYFVSFHIRRTDLSVVRSVSGLFWCSTSHSLLVTSPDHKSLNTTCLYWCIYKCAQLYNGCLNSKFGLTTFEGQIWAKFICGVDCGVRDTSSLFACLNYATLFIHATLKCILGDSVCMHKVYTLTHTVFLLKCRNPANDIHSCLVNTLFTVVSHTTTILNVRMVSECRLWERVGGGIPYYIGMYPSHVTSGVNRWMLYIAGMIWERHVHWRRPNART